MTNPYADLTALYEAQRRPLESRISRMVRCRSTAADLVQDIFLRLWARSSGPSGDAVGYLVRSARNAAIDHLRTAQTHRRLLDGTMPEQHGAPPPTPYEILDGRQQLSRVDRTLLALPERTRHIFLLNRLHGRTYAEIATAFRISASAVEKHMVRALAALRDELHGSSHV